MIGDEEIRAALDRLEPQLRAANTIAAAFGGPETVPTQRDIAALVGVEWEALGGLLASVLDSTIQDGRDHPKEYTEGYAQGFLTGAMAAREEAGDG